MEGCSSEPQTATSSTGGLSQLGTDPPRFGYRWHVTSPPDEATHVEIRFADGGDGTTRVTILHSGFDRLGDKGPLRRDGNLRYWETLVPAFTKACEHANTR